jgi:hypothetical protein
LSEVVALDEPSRAAFALDPLKLLLRILLELDGFVFVLSGLMLPACIVVCRRFELDEFNEFDELDETIIGWR